jgi:hypothetical protein
MRKDKVPRRTIIIFLALSVDELASKLYTKEPAVNYANLGYYSCEMGGCKFGMNGWMDGCVVCGR